MKWTFPVLYRQFLSYRQHFLYRFELNKGKPLLSTDDTVKMIEFSSIFYRFQMPYRYPQEFGFQPDRFSGSSRSDFLKMDPNFDVRAVFRFRSFQTEQF